MERKETVDQEGSIIGLKLKVRDVGSECWIWSRGTKLMVF